MSFDPPRSGSDPSTGSEQTGSIEIDPETLSRIDYALKGTIDVDISKLPPDDKLALLIERYNRKVRELEQAEHHDQ
jgi:hypothetical protein